MPEYSKDGHRCFAKIRKIMERVGILTTHAEITYICEHIFHSKNEDEFYKELEKLSDDQLRDLLHRMRRRAGVTVQAEEELLAYA